MNEKDSGQLSKLKWQPSVEAVISSGLPETGVYGLQIHSCSHYEDFFKVNQRYVWFDVVSPGRGFYKELRTGNRKGAIKIARILIQKSRYFLEEDKKCSPNSC